MSSDFHGFYRSVDAASEISEEISISTVIKPTLPENTYPTTHWDMNFNYLPSALIAVSEEIGNYILWVGFYENSLFIANYELQWYDDVLKVIDLTSYKNKTINITVTCKKNGTCDTYINGDLVDSRSAGSSGLSYKDITIGDLRSFRGLEYNGNLYDMKIYNKKISSEAVKNLYAENKIKYNL